MKQKECGRRLIGQIEAGKTYFEQIQISIFIKVIDGNDDITNI